MKKDQYFKLEVNMLNEDNIVGMMGEMYAPEAVGIYVMLLLHLRTKDSYEASCQPTFMKAFAQRYGVKLKALMRVLYDFDLFEVNEKEQTFRAPYLDRVMKNLEERWEQNRVNGQKGGRPRKCSKTSETPTSKGQKPNETQERREEEKRNITPVNNSSNIPLPMVDATAAATAVVTTATAAVAIPVSGAVPIALPVTEKTSVTSSSSADSQTASLPAVDSPANGSPVVSLPVVDSLANSSSVVALLAVDSLANGSLVVSPSVVDSPANSSAVVASRVRMRIRSVDEEGQRPLQPVHSWEKLVRQLSASREYMELAGMHSGLGQLFVDNQKRILELFAAHIRLYDKGGQLLFFEDVKRYFSNYIAAGSTTCRIVRETLLSELRQRKKDDTHCFETVIGGQRTYFGRPIPDEAPPRPDASAVWDGIRRRWAH